METRTVKERLLEDLRSAPRTKDELLEQFDGSRQQRGAAGVLAYLLRSDQVEIVDGRYVLTGRKRKLEPTPRAAVPQPMSWPTSTLQVEPPVVQSEPELQWALWHDGDLLIRRGEVNLVLTPNERKSIVDWLQKVVA